MTRPAEIRFSETDTADLKDRPGRIAVLADAEGRMAKGGRRLDALMRRGLSRFLGSSRFAKMKTGEAAELAFPGTLAADGVIVVRLPRRPTVAEARKAGAALAKARGDGPLLVLAEFTARIEQLSLGLALRGYDFTDHKTARDGDAGQETGAPVTIMCGQPEEVARAAGPKAAVAEGVFFARDLVNEPANVLTTDDFAARLAAMQELGLDVEILEEADLAKLGMRALLAVGQGSESPSKVVVMQWHGGAKGEKPLALVGKGVVFDTGGISIKPAAGMEEMTMDMGGAAVVAGVMRTLALRKAKANVVGLVGLVENMPDGRAQRPGDVVRSMKGDTIEVINTDAEGRLVLADVMWHAQQAFDPAAMIDLATLTGAIIIGLGHENAGVFSNDDAFCGALLRAAGEEGEGAWRMPMGAAYDEMLKSRIADMKNVGGRPAGSITAAQFLARFVKEGLPWAHIDIAGVASTPADTDLAPKGATGWGVMTLDRLIADRFESGPA